MNKIYAKTDMNEIKNASWAVESSDMSDETPITTSVKLIFNAVAALAVLVSFVYAFNQDFRETAHFAVESGWHNKDNVAEVMHKIELRH